MTVFSEKVIPTFTSSDHNIIVVESFNEIFFDVFELEINGNKYVAEKVSEKDGKPIVSIPLTHNGQKKNVPFLLERGDETAVYYNDSNTRLIRPVRETKIEKIDILNLVETKIQERVPLFEIPDVERAVDNIKAVKESAVEYLNKCRSEYVEAQKREIDSFENKKKQEIKKLNEEYRKNMVSEFLSLTENVKNQILESNSEERADYNGYIRELFVEYCQEIEDRVDNNYETAINSLESKVNTLTETVFADKIQNIFENRVNEVEKIISANDTLTNKKLYKELSRINAQINSKIDDSSRENIKSIESLAERYDNALRTLEESVIDTNNNFQKSSNKALSRIGNVKNELSEKIDKVNLDINTLSEIQVGLRENIETHRGNIKKYFNKKISFLDTKITDVNEEYKKDIINLIRESERKLLEEIAGIDTKLPTLILKEARTKKDNVEVSLEDIRKELENNISGRFSKEIVSLKRLIEMTSGGGGGGAGGGSQTLLFDENTALLSISNGNAVSLSALSGGGGGGGGITVETDPKFTTWAQSNSAKYESTYTTVSSNSGNWNYQGSDIKALTANWQSTYTTVSGNSANWNSTYNTVYSTSGSWNYQGADIKALTANWQNTYTTVSGSSAKYDSTYTSLNTNSAKYDSVYTSLNANSAKYDSTYTTVSGNSANWNSTYNTVYTASGSWDYQGIDIKSLTANWQSTYTTVSTYSAGWGLGGGSDNQTLSFNENDATLSILRGNTISLSALSGGGSGTGITVETDPIFTTWAQSNSAKYESTYTSFNTNSAKYDSVYTTVGANSAGWGSLSALNDVNIPSPVNGQVLQYSSATNKWIAGSPASATGATGYYGSFFDTTAGVLTAANQAKKVAIAQTFESNGITVNDSKIIFSHAGTYELIYSIQYKSLDNDPQDIYIWLRKNGVDVPDSSSIFLINAKKSAGIPSQLIAVTPFIATLTAGEYLEIYWHCEAYTNVSIETFTVNHNDPTIPRTPGAIITVKQITNLLLPTVGTYLPLSGGSLTGPVSSNQDIEITDSTKGIILRSPSSIKYRVTVSDAGELITTQI